MNPADNPWLVPGINERLIELQALSGPQMLAFREITKRLNEEFGTRLTRHASIGRAHRLGLPRRETILQVRPSKPKPKPEPRAMTKPKFVPVQPKLPAYRMVETGGVPLLELGRGQCHWPYGGLLDRPKLFCGRETVGETSWCPDHYALVYDRKRA